MSSDAVTPAVCTLQRSGRDGGACFRRWCAAAAAAGAAAANAAAAKQFTDL